MPLTAKPERFALEYTADLCATQAAIRAGYCKRCAAEIGSENLRKDPCQSCLADADLVDLMNEDSSVSKGDSLLSAVARR